MRRVKVKMEREIKTHVQIKKNLMSVCVRASFNDFFYDIVSEQQNVAMLPTGSHLDHFKYSTHESDWFIRDFWLFEWTNLFEKIPCKVGFFNATRTCLCDKFSGQEIYDRPELQSNSLNSLLRHVTSQWMLQNDLILIFKKLFVYILVKL